MNKFHCGIELPNFLPDEFLCPCCGVEKMQKDTLLALQSIRDALGRSIGIVEGGGYRCAIYDANEHSAHRGGYAADLNIDRSLYYQLIGLAQMTGFQGIGIKNRTVGGVPEFQLHIDTAPNLPGIRPRPWVWTYD